MAPDELAPAADDFESNRAELFEQVYDELRRIAASKMARLSPGSTLQATALVHEVYVRFEQRGLQSWETRGHFFFDAARAMRDILVESARKKSSLKRGGDRQRLPIELANLEVDLPDDDIVSLHEALNQLEIHHPESARLVLLRYFAGIGADETAKVLGVSPATFRRKWRFAWAWLRRYMSDNEGDGHELE